jgi:chromate transporter
MNEVVTAPRPHPHSLTELFIAFTLLALQGFGGVMAVVQRELVERKQWLTPQEFVEDWAVAQIMPGPNVVNLSLMIGGRYFGLRGAVVALTGMLAAPLVLVLLLVILHGSIGNSPIVAGALRGVTAVSAGMIGAAGVKLMVSLKKNPMPMAWCLGLCGLCFMLVALVHAPLAYVLLGVGGLACCLCYRCLAA